MKKLKKKQNKFVKYLKETFLNKLCALSLVGLGLLSLNVSNDITFLVFLLIGAIPLFFAKQNYICKD